jgi:ribonuclease HI
MTEQRITIFCDGACSGNQSKLNKGGWGAIVKLKEGTKTVYGGERNTTNQRMELTACIKALECLTLPKIGVDLYSDSAYLVNCFRDKWYENWQKNCWRNSKKQPVENQDLWRRLLELTDKYNVTFHKVNGHSGNTLNELADKLAQKGIDNL